MLHPLVSWVFAHQMKQACDVPCTGGGDGGCDGGAGDDGGGVVVAQMMGDGMAEGVTVSRGRTGFRSS